MTTAAERTDGRTERSRRTRLAVVKAMLDLINAGDLRPTAQQVSEAAGVALRTVFHHFDDLETLFAEAADVQVDRMSALTTEIDPGLAFDERLERFVEARARLLQDISPVRRSALLHEPFSPVIAERLAWSRKVNREETDRIFAAELDPTPEVVRAALHTATEWPAWETLRVHEGLSFECAKDVMSHTIRALLRKEME